MCDDCSNDGFLFFFCVVCFVSASISYSLGRFAGVEIGSNTVRSEAVQRGFAEQIEGVDGDKIFIWKTDETKELEEASE